MTNVVPQPNDVVSTIREQHAQARQLIGTIKAATPDAERTRSPNWQECCTPTKQPNNQSSIQPFATWATRASVSPNNGSPRKSKRARCSPNSKRRTRRPQSSKKASQRSAEMSNSTPGARRQRCSHCWRSSTTLDEAELGDAFVSAQTAHRAVTTRSDLRSWNSRPSRRLRNA